MSGAVQNDIDDVFERIGGFGRFQTKTYFLMNLVHIVCGIHTLILAFIGIEPNWTCEGPNNHQDKCLQYGLDECTPHYDSAITSVVAEVRLS